MNNILVIMLVRNTCSIVLVSVPYLLLKNDSIIHCILEGN